FDIASSNYVPKPRLQCYEVFVRTHGVDADACAMFEDIARNLEAAHALGMTTVLVRPESAPEDAANPLEAPEPVHHVTDDLEGFLRGLLPERPATEMAGP